LFRAAHSHNPARYSHIVGFHPAFMLIAGGFQGRSPTYEQAHVGSDLLTLVSEDTLKRKHGDMSMEETKKISAAVIRRLPRYYRYLGELIESGVQRISSKELSAKMKVTASQIRQDLNNFGGFGQQGYGYNVKYLYDEIAKILGIDRPHNMIIIGAGNLGQAIVNYEDFEKRGFVIKGVFDNNPEMEGKTIRGIPVMMMDAVSDFIKRNEIEIVALTIPKKAAKEVGKLVADAGIKAIWNFAHTDLNLPDEVIVENVHLSESLMRLSYTIANEGR
jgi:redox-sensing transcriptional repressor